MLKTTTLNISEIGVVLFEKSRRAKRLNITVKPFKGVRVAVVVSDSIFFSEDWIPVFTGMTEERNPRIKFGG